jgi:hypothetical protein
MRAVDVERVRLAIADCADLRIVPTLPRHPLRSRRFVLATSAHSCPDESPGPNRAARSGFTTNTPSCCSDRVVVGVGESIDTHEVSDRAGRVSSQMNP